MPIKDATFWFGMTLLGAGIQIAFQHAGTRRLWGVILTALGGLAAGYSVFAFYHPRFSIAVPIWVYLLIVTWASIAYGVYDNHRTSAKRKEFDSIAAEVIALRQSLKKRELDRCPFTVQKIWADLSADLKVDYRDKVRLILTNATSSDIMVWTPTWESAEVHSQYPFGSSLHLPESPGWKGDRWDAGHQSLKLGP